MENLLGFNWACLRLFRASQILYRPLQRPNQQRILQQCAYAQFKFRLVENGDVYVRAWSTKHAIQRSYAEECWPNGPNLVQSLPAVGLPSDIVAIERIRLWLTTDEKQRRLCVQQNGLCPHTWEVKCFCFVKKCFFPVFSAFSAFSLFFQCFFLVFFWFFKFNLTLLNLT